MTPEPTFGVFSDFVRPFLTEFVFKNHKEFLSAVLKLAIKPESSSGLSFYSHYIEQSDRDNS